MRLVRGNRAKAGLGLWMAASIWFVTAAFPQPALPADQALSATLTQFSPWLGPDGTLQIQLEITNQSDEELSGLSVVVSILEEVASRSDLGEALAGRIDRRPARWTDTLAVDGTIPSRSKRVVEVDKKLSEISFFRSSAPDRAYPIRIVARSGRRSASPVDTQLIFFSEPAAERLRLGLVIPLQPSLRGPGESLAFRDAEASKPGRLAGIVDALAAHPDAGVTLAPGGLFLDLLAQTSRGSQLSLTQSSKPSGESDTQAPAQVLESLRALAARPNVRIIEAPYSGAFLPGLARSDLADQIEAQMNETAAAIKSQLRADPLAGWTLPTAGALEDASAATLARLSLNRFLISRSSVSGQAPSLTLGAPVEIGSAHSGTMGALVVDGGLADRLSEQVPGGPVVARQRFLAEAATIMAERPAQRRGVVVVAPLDWAPDPVVLGGILDAMSKSPWMAGSTPDAIVAEIAQGAPVSLAGSDAVLKSGPDIPAKDYLDALRAARRSLDHYGSLQPGADRIAALQKRLLAAESAELWSSRTGLDRGKAIARSVDARVKDQFRKIRGPVPQTITFSSRAGTIPLDMHSLIDYPVRVVLRLESDKLAFGDAQRCGDRARFGVCTMDLELRPRIQTVVVKAEAQATGRFPVRVSLLTEGDGSRIDSSRVLVRSTDYNRVALGITGGAGVFLIMWWLAGMVARRPHPHPEPASQPGS